MLQKHSIFHNLHWITTDGYKWNMQKVGNKMFMAKCIDHQMHIASAMHFTIMFDKWKAMTIMWVVSLTCK